LAAPWYSTARAIASPAAASTATPTTAITPLRMTGTVKQRDRSTERP
jgi:hypothetical protein